MNDLNYLLVKREDAQAAEYLAKLGAGRDAVTTSDDWVVLSKLFEFWTRKWPSEWSEYVESMDLIKRTRLKSSGMSATGGIKYVAALPRRFERMIRAVFPDQQFNKEFIYKLVRNIKIVQVGQKNEAWFTIPAGEAPKPKLDDIVKKTIKDMEVKDGDTR